MILGPTENHSLLSPAVYSQSMLSQRLGGTVARDIRLFPEYAVLARSIAAANPDVVIVRGLTRWFMRMAAFLAVAQRRRVVIYDQEGPNQVGFGTWIRRATCRAVGVIHFTPKIDDNTHHQSWASAWQIPFGNAFSNSGMSRPIAPQWPPRILMVGKYRPRKRHADLLCALRLLTGLPFSITFCGEEASSDDREACVSLGKLAGELGLASRLTFRNNVPHYLMADLYAAHDIFVLPAQNEPAAISPLEAVWCGCAALVTETSGTRSYLPPSNTFSFRDGDIDDLARALSQMMESPQALADARRACAVRMSALANDERIRTDFERLLA